MKISYYWSEPPRLPGQDPVYEKRPRHVWACSDWTVLAQALRPIPVLHKETWLITPLELVEGHELTKGTPQSSMIGAHFAVLDFDSVGPKKNGVWITEDQIAEIVSDLKHPYILASSFSHTGRGLFRGRLILPTSRIVLPSEWKRFWDVLNRKVGKGLGDPLCKDITRRYFVPSYLEGGPAPPVYLWSAEGPPIPVDEFLLEAAPSQAAGLGGLASSGVPSAAQIRGLADRLEKKGTEIGARWATALRRLAKGQAYAEAGERDSLTWELANRIVETWPTTDADRAAEDLFRPSLEAMHSVDSEAPTLSSVADKFRRAQAALLGERTARIREVRRHTSDFYNSDEIESFCEAHSCTATDLRRRLILQKGGSYYIMLEGKYVGPYGRDDFEAAARDRLSPFPWVELDVLGQKSVQPKSGKAFVRDYGTVIESVRSDLSAQRSYYDADKRILVNAPCPLPDWTPQRHAAVETWLRLLGGAFYEKFEQWLITLIRVDLPLSALYLKGPKDVGKSLFGLCAASVWGSSPTTPEDLVSTFNFQTERNPVVFADETSPLGHKSDDLRRLIQKPTHTLNRKFHDAVEMRGYLRLIYAANSTRAARGRESLDKDDIEAINDRMLAIEVEAAVSDYVRTLGRKTTEGWVRGEFAEHLFWLVSTVERRPEGRFHVNGGSEDLGRSFAVETGYRPDVCMWLMNFLMDPKKLLNIKPAAGLASVNKGRLLVNSKALVDHWDVYVANKSVLASSEIIRALSGLSFNQRVWLGPEESRIAYKHVDLALLSAWAKNSSYGAEDVDRLVLRAEAIMRGDLR